MKIGWIVSGDRGVAGARLQGYLMHEQLLRIGVKSVLVHTPDIYDTGIRNEALLIKAIRECNCSVVVFQKVCEGRASVLASLLRDSGIGTIYIACNTVGRNMVEACDRTIAVSSALKKWFGYRLRRKIRVIPDAVEVPPQKYKRQYSQTSEALRVVCVGGTRPDERMLACIAGCGNNIVISEISAGAAPNPPLTAVVTPPMISRSKRLIRMHPIDLVWKIQMKLFCRRYNRQYDPIYAESVHKVIHEEWDIKTIMDRIIEHDVAVIPCDLRYDWDIAKSSNRLTMFMALGMPVVASPLPAYREIVRHGKNGFIANSTKDWKKALGTLQDEEVRKRIGLAARKTACPKFDTATIARQYLGVISDTVD